MIYHKSFS